MNENVGHCTLYVYTISNSVIDLQDKLKLFKNYFTLTAGLAYRVLHIPLPNSLFIQYQ